MPKYRSRGKTFFRVYSYADVVFSGETELGVKRNGILGCCQENENHDRVWSAKNVYNMSRGSG